MLNEFDHTVQNSTNHRILLDKKINFDLVLHSIKKRSNVFITGRLIYQLLTTKIVHFSISVSVFSLRNRVDRLFSGAGHPVLDLFDGPRDDGHDFAPVEERAQWFTSTRMFSMWIGLKSGIDANGRREDGGTLRMYPLTSFVKKNIG